MLIGLLLVCTMGGELKRMAVESAGAETKASASVVEEGEYKPPA